MAKSQNIFLIGPLGAGKTSIGRYLATELQMEYYDSDYEIEQRTGADLSWIFELEGEQGFRKREALVVDELTNKTGIVLSTGGGSILRPENREALSVRGLVIYLQVSIEQQLSRTKRTDTRPLLVDQENPREILEKLHQEREHLYEEIADLTYLTDGKSVRLLGSLIIRDIRKGVY